MAVVTGASRGIGRGIALELAECGATVYITARSSGKSAAADKMAGTIEDTAGEITMRGGVAIPVRCDASRLEDLQALFARVKSESQGLDILVNNAWGGYEEHAGGLRPAYFWDTPFEQLWQGMMQSGLRSHMATTCCAIPLVLNRPGGLICSTIAWDHDKYLGNFYDVSKHAIVRFLFGLSLELKNHKAPPRASHRDSPVRSGFWRPSKRTKLTGAIFRI